MSLARCIETAARRVKDAERDRDNALTIARGYHDQWAEADRELAREPVALAYARGYERGLEDAAQLVSAMEDWDEAQWLAEKIRALSPQAAPSAEWAHDLPEGHVQIPEKQTSPAAEPPQTERLPGLQDQPIEW